MRHQYPSRTAAICVVGAIVVIIAICMVLFRSADAGQRQGTSDIIYDETHALAYGSPETVLTLPAAGAPLESIEIIGTVRLTATITHSRSGEFGLVTLPFAAAEARWGPYVPLTATRIEWRASDAVTSQDVAGVPLVQGVVAEQSGSTLITGVLAQYETAEWQLAFSGFVGIAVAGEGSHSSTGSGTLGLQVIYHYAGEPRSPRAAVKQRTQPLMPLTSSADDSHVVPFGHE